MSNENSINCQRREDRDISSWPGGRFEYSSFEDFLNCHRIETGTHTIYDGGEIIDFFYENNDSECLVGIFHGAVQAQKIAGLTLPVFAGMKIALGMQVDRILFSDATMAVHKALRLGWFSGHSDYDFSQRIDEVLEKVTSFKAFRRILLLGGSQGGFAALRASHRIANSVALVWNPQTRIRDFFIKSHLAGFLQHCFGVDQYNAIPEALRDERAFDLPKLYQGKAAQNYAFIMQNLEDVDHLEDHAKPLAAAMGYDPERINMGVNKISPHMICALGDWEGGHSLPDRLTLERVADLILSSDLSSADLFNQVDFQAILPPSFLSNASQSKKPGGGVERVKNLPRQRQGLTMRERSFILGVMEAAPRKWHLQYGMSNILAAAAEFGFRQISAIDGNAERVSAFKKSLDPMIRGTGSVAYMLHADIGPMDAAGWPTDMSLGRRWPNYVIKPWRWPLETETAPDTIFVNGPFTVPIAMQAAMRRCIWQDNTDTKLLVMDLDPKGKSFEILSEHFSVEDCVGRISCLRLRDNLDKQNVLTDFTIYIINQN